MSAPLLPTIESALTAYRQETGAEWTAADHATDHLTGPGQTDAATGPPRDIPASTILRLGASGPPSGTNDPGGRPRTRDHLNVSAGAVAKEARCKSFD